MSENNHLSFLSPIRGSLQPTLLNLELSFPGRLFWKFALLEHYTVGDTELAEKYANLSQRTPVPPRKE